MAAPHVTSAAALHPPEGPDADAGARRGHPRVDGAALPSSGSPSVYDISPTAGFYTKSWDTNCHGTPCDAVGSGLLQVDKALAAASAKKR